MSTLVSNRVFDTKVVSVDKVTVALWEFQGRKTFVEQYGDPAWTRDNIETVVQRVNKGALLLDRENPGWVEQIIPAKLDMSNATFCIIGQSYGNYDEYIGVPFGQAGMTYREAEPYALEHGFITEADADDSSKMIPYPLLDRVWVAMLSERHARQEPVVLALPPPVARNESYRLVSDLGLSQDELVYLRLPGDVL